MQYGISFDFWNTLYASGDEIQRHRKRVSFFHDLLSAYGPFEETTVEEAFEWSRQHFINSWQVQQHTPTAETRIRLIADRLNVPLSSTEIEKTTDYFGNLIHRIPPLEIVHLKTCIQSLVTRFPLALISDTGYISGRYIRSFLDKENLLSLFRSMIFSDEQNHCKPHISVFDQTCRNLGIDCAHLIHIGDLEQTDVRGILACGGISIKFTGVSGRHEENTASAYSIDNYKELPSLIKNLTRS